jgi:hypothetical protein
LFVCLFLHKYVQIVTKWLQIVSVLPGCEQ